MEDATCSVPACPNLAKRVGRSGLCSAHYARKYRHGDVLADVPLQPKGQPKPRCSIDGCDRPAASRGWCSMHYWRWRKNGDPLNVRPNRQGENSNSWRGVDVGYGGAHERVRALHGSPRSHRCVQCGNQAAHWAYDHADPNEMVGLNRGVRCAYSADPDHYQAMCVPCHKRFDLEHIAAKAVTDSASVCEVRRAAACS